MKTMIISVTIISTKYIETVLRTFFFAEYNVILSVESCVLIIFLLLFLCLLGYCSPLTKVRVIEGGCDWWFPLYWCFHDALSVTISIPIMIFSTVWFAITSIEMRYNDGGLFTIFYWVIRRICYCHLYFLIHVTIMFWIVLLVCLSPVVLLKYRFEKVATFHFRQDTCLLILYVVLKSPFIGMPFIDLAKHCIE